MLVVNVPTKPKSMKQNREKNLRQLHPSYAKRLIEIVIKYDVKYNKCNVK